MQKWNPDTVDAVRQVHSSATLVILTNGASCCLAELQHLSVALNCSPAIAAVMRGVKSAWVLRGKCLAENSELGRGRIHSRRVRQATVYGVNQIVLSTSGVRNTYLDMPTAP